MKYAKLLIICLLMASFFSIAEARTYYRYDDDDDYDRSGTWVQQGPGYTVYHYDSPNKYYRTYYDDDRRISYRYEDGRRIYYGYNYDGRYYNDDDRYYDDDARYYSGNYYGNSYYSTNRYYYHDDIVRENLYYSMNGYRSGDVRTCTTYGGETRCFYLN